MTDPWGDSPTGQLKEVRNKEAYRKLNSIHFYIKIKSLNPFWGLILLDSY